MARPKKSDDERLMQIPANVPPKTVETLRDLATKRDWSLAQTVRKMIELGLNVELSGVAPATPKSRSARGKALQAT